MKYKFKVSTASIIALALLFIIALDYIPEHHQQKLVFSYQTKQRPLIIANRGAKLLFPENTLLAFDSCIAMGVDILEMDVRLTRDSQLVCLHDKTIDRTSNGRGQVDRYTLLVLKQLNFAEKFKNINGKNPYKDTIIKIPSLEQVFVRYPNIPLMIELKDNKKNGEKAARNLAYLLHKYKRKKTVVITSFHENTLYYFRKITNNQYLTTAGKKEVEEFVVTKKIFLSKFFKPKGNFLALPIYSEGINLCTNDILKKARQKGYQIYYWTINTEKEMHFLINKKVDGLQTDRPDILIPLLHKKAKPIEKLYFY